MSSSERWFMVVAAGLLQIPLIEAAQTLGFRVVAIDRNAEAPGMRVAERGVTLDIKDVPGALRLARELSVAGVATAACEPAMPTVAAVAAALGTPAPTPDAVAKATDKSAMRSAFKVAGLAIPRFEPVRNLDEAQCAVDTVGGMPVIVKPTGSSGSRGVSRAMTGQQLAAAVAHAQSFSEVVLIEQMLVGVEISVEALTYGGATRIITLSDKSITPWPYPVENGQAQPSTQPAAIWDEVSKLAADAIAAVGLDDTASHTEVMVCSDGCYLIEIGARLGGDFMGTHMTPYSAGVDMTRAVVQIATGMPLDPEPLPQRGRGIAVRYLIPEPGQVERIVMPPGIEDDPDILDWAVYVTVGDVVEPIRSSTDRAGHVLAIGATADSAIAKAQAVCDAITVETTPQRTRRAGAPT